MAVTPKWIRGASAIRFTAGTGERLGRTSSSGLPGAIATACGWFRQGVNTGAVQTLLSFDDSFAAGGDNHVIYLSSTNVLRIYAIGSGGSSAFGSSPAIGTPFFAALSINGASAATGYWCYPEDRKLVSQTSTSTSSGAPTEFCSGNSGLFTTDALNGSAWNIRLFNRVLSEAEVTREAMSLTPVAEDALYGWWPVEGDSTQWIRDWSGNFRDLITTGSPRAEPFFLPREQFFGARPDARLAPAPAAQVLDDVLRRVGMQSILAQ